MHKQELQLRLQENHQVFAAYLQSLSPEAFTRSNNQKWTPGQQLDHIRRSLQPVILAMALPGFVLRLLFGKANRPSRTYEALVEKYQHKLQQGGRASGRFVPPAIPASAQKALIATVLSLADQLCRRTGTWAEADLDAYILPHPLLGKLTVREMLYFTLYHVEHHHGLTKRDLGV